MLNLSMLIMGILTSVERIRCEDIVSNNYVHQATYLWDILLGGWVESNATSKLLALPHSHIKEYCWHCFAMALWLSDFLILFLLHVVCS